MIRALVLLLDLLTNYQAVESLAHDVFTLGLASTGIACLFGSFEIVRCLKLRTLAPSRAWNFEDPRRHSI
jgi:hypothetical protein